MNSAFHPFACPVCGRVRDVSARAFREINQGARTGECHQGSGCRAVTRAERFKRWWLVEICCVPDDQVRRAGGAAAYVLEFGMPDIPDFDPPHRVPRTKPVLRAVRGATEGNFSQLVRFSYQQADCNPELALWLAIEILVRGVPAHTYVTMDATELPLSPPTLVAA